MAEQISELNEVKSVIRGLLISSTTRMTIRQLEVDYLKQEGCSIPIRKLGYTSIETFLYSIPDTVNLRNPRSGCPYHMFIVEPVQSKKSNHVEKMVIRQKNSSKTIRGMKRTSAVPEPLSQKRISNSPMLNGMAPRFVPMTLRIALSHVCDRFAQVGFPLSSLGDELTQNLCETGLSRKGHFNWLKTHGFGNIEELIDSFIDQDLIRVITRNGSEWIIPTIKNEISKHKTSEVVNDDSISRVESDTCSSYKAETFTALSDPYSDNGGCSIMPAGAESLSVDELLEDDLPVTSLISDKMKKNFQAILRKYPDGLWCSSLPYEYYKLTGSELDIKQLGFVSMIQMASRLKDVFICTRPNSNSDWLLFDATSNSIWNTPASPACKERKLATLPTYVVKNIESLLAVSPQGIKKHQFLDVYKETYEEELPMIDFGFENIMALLAHLATRGIVHLKFVGSDPMVCRPIKNVADGVSLKDLRQEDDFIDALYPKGVMTPKDDIAVQTLPEKLIPGCSLDILVSEVVTPSFFWFQIWAPDIQGEFDSLMDSLQEFYGAHDYKMPDATMQIGLYCATLYPAPPTSVISEWHRARITALPSPTEAEVLYVDYGTKSKVLRSNLHFLDLKYSRLPVQGFKAGLYHIRPRDYGKLHKSGGHLPTWSKEATNTFLRLVSNRPMVAVIAKIRQPDKFLSIALTDTSKEVDKHINDILVAAKLAELGHMADAEDHEEEVMSTSFVEEKSLPASSKTCYKEEEESPGCDIENPMSQPMPPRMISSTPIPVPAENVMHGRILNQSIPSVPYVESSPRGRVFPAGETNMFSQTSAENVMHGRILNQSIPSMPYVESSPKGNVFPAGETSMLSQAPAENVMHGRILNQSIPSVPYVESSPRGSVFPAGEASMLSQNPVGSIASSLNQSNPSISHLEGQQRESLNPANWVNMQPLMQCFTGLDPRQQNELLRLVGELRIMTENSRKELESLKMLQQKWQYDELYNKILFLSAQNFMFPSMPPGLNPNSVSQVVPPPPPGLANMNLFRNMAPSYNEMVARAIQNNNNPFIPCNNLFPAVALPSCGNPPLGNFGYPQLFGATYFDQGVSPSANMYTPPGFETSVPPVQVTDSWHQQSVNPSPIPQESFNTGVGEQFNPMIKSELREPTPKVIAVPVTNNHDLPVGRSSSEKSDNFSKNISSVPSSDILTCGLTENDGQGDFSKTKMCNLKSSSGTNNPSNYKPNPKKCEGVTDLHSSFEACSISSCGVEGFSSSVVDNFVEKDTVKKMNGERNIKNNIRIIIEHENIEEGKPNICKGNVNGSSVNIVKIDGYPYVLTEEILALFFCNIPVHVATRIIGIRPMGKNIVSTSINPRKNRDIFQQIGSLGTIEINPRGSDIHLTSVDTLEILFSTLDQPT